MVKFLDFFKKNIGVVAGVGVAVVVVVVATVVISVVVKKKAASSSSQSSSSSTSSSSESSSSSSTPLPLLTQLLSNSYTISTYYYGISGAHGITLTHPSNYTIVATFNQGPAYTQYEDFVSTTSTDPINTITLNAANSAVSVVFTRLGDTMVRYERFIYGTQSVYKYDMTQN